MLNKKKLNMTVILPKLDTPEYNSNCDLLRN